MRGTLPAAGGKAAEAEAEADKRGPPAWGWAQKSAR